MKVISNSSVPSCDSKSLTALSNIVRVTIFAAFLASSIMVSPTIAKENWRDLATFFGGHLTAKGQFQNFHDGSTRGVRVDMQGKSEGRAFRIIMDATYSDGEKEHKVWRFLKVAEGRYVGYRADLIGKATVVVQGNKIDITYVARVRRKDSKTYNLNFKETFLFKQPGTGAYWIRVSLLFVPIGEARLIVRKQSH
jgi:uncharacterized protein DUF3833